MNNETNDLNFYPIYIVIMFSAMTLVKSQEAPFPLSDDFSKDTGYWSYVGTAYRDERNGYVVLTSATNGQVGIIWLNYDIYPPFIVEFKYKAGGGTGADGLVFMFLKKRDYTPAGGGWLGFEGNINNRINPVPGYGVEFDNYYNREFNDPSSGHIALIKDTVRNHLIYKNDRRVEDNRWHNVRVEVGDNYVKVYVDNQIVFNWEGYLDTTYGGLGFAASTGGANNWHIIDDVKVYAINYKPIVTIEPIPSPSEEVKIFYDFSKPVYFQKFEGHGCYMGRIWPGKGGTVKIEQGVMKIRTNSYWYSVVAKIPTEFPGSIEDYNIYFSFKFKMLVPKSSGVGFSMSRGIHPLEYAGYVDIFSIGFGAGNWYDDYSTYDIAIGHTYGDDDPCAKRKFVGFKYRFKSKKLLKTGVWYTVKVSIVGNKLSIIVVSERGEIILNEEIIDNGILKALKLIGKPEYITLGTGQGYHWYKYAETWYDDVKIVLTKKPTSKPPKPPEEVEPPLNIDVFDSSDLTFDKSGDDWAYIKTSGDIIGLKLTGPRESVALLKKRIKVDLTNPVVVEYRIRFDWRATYSYAPQDRSHATVNIFLNPPSPTSSWWNDPIATAIYGPINNNVLTFLHSFGPNTVWGGKVGVDSTIEGKNIPPRSAPYPQDGEWVTVKVKITRDGFEVTSVGDQGYYRYERYNYNNENLKYIAIGFGDHHKTRVEVDYIKVYYEKIMQKPKLRLTMECDTYLKQGEIRQAKLVIENIGVTSAKNVKVTITSPLLGRNITKEYDTIPSKEAKMITFQVSPKEAGRFLITAIVEYQDNEGNRYVKTTEKIIEVEPVSTAPVLPNETMEEEKPKLKLLIECDSLIKLGEVRSVKVTIENVGNEDARNVKVTITSPLLGINIEDSYDAILSKEARTITFKVAPKEIGKFKIVAIVEYRDNEGNKYVETAEKMIEVESLPATSEQVTPTRETTPVRGICGPSIILLIATITGLIAYMLRRYD